MKLLEGNVRNGDIAAAQASLLFFAVFLSRSADVQKAAVDGVHHAGKRGREQKI